MLSDDKERLIKVTFSDGSTFVGTPEEWMAWLTERTRQLWQQRLDEVFGDTDPQTAQFHDEDDVVIVILPGKKPPPGYTVIPPEPTNEC